MTEIDDVVETTQPEVIYIEPIDYTAQLQELSGQLEDITTQLEDVVKYSVSLDKQVIEIKEDTAEIYTSSGLILGTMIVFILFRFVTSFLSRIFSDTTNY